MYGDVWSQTREPLCVVVHVRTCTYTSPIYTPPHPPHPRNTVVACCGDTAVVGTLQGINTHSHIEHIEHTTQLYSHGNYGSGTCRASKSAGPAYFDLSDTLTITL